MKTRIKPGAALRTPSCLIQELIKWVTLCEPLALRRHQTQRFKDGASSHKIEYVAYVEEIQNFKGYQNCAAFKADLFIGKLRNLWKKIKRKKVKSFKNQLKNLR